MGEGDVFCISWGGSYILLQKGKDMSPSVRGTIAHRVFKPKGTLDYVPNEIDHEFLVPKEFME